VKNRQRLGEIIKLRTGDESYTPIWNCSIKARNPSQGQSYNNDNSTPTKRYDSFWYPTQAGLSLK